MNKFIEKQIHVVRGDKVYYYNININKINIFK